MKNYNDRWNSGAAGDSVDKIPADELEKAISYVDGGSKSEKYLSVILEAARRYRVVDATVQLYNEEEGGEHFAGRLKALYCPTCKKKVPYGYTRCTKPSETRCNRCGQICRITQEMLDKR